MSSGDTGFEQNAAKSAPTSTMGMQLSFETVLQRNVRS